MTGYLTIEETAGLRTPNPVFIKTIQGNPDFIDASNNDYCLSSTSSCLDRRGFLTFTTSAGSETNVPVVDAHFFIDGYGIVESNTIQMANGKRNDGSLKIVAVDYNKNILTLNHSIN